MITHQHWRYLDQQAASFKIRQHRHLLKQCVTQWAHLVQLRLQQRRIAARALRRMHQFHLQRLLLAWYYGIHNLKLHRLKVQLADRQATLLDVHQQARDASKEIQGLQLERAQLHQRLERVAEHAKVQVGQLAVTNDKVQALQQRDADHQMTLEECRTLKATLAEMDSLLRHARSGRVELESALAEAQTAQVNAAAAAQQGHGELQATRSGLQRHLASRKATMDACTSLLEAHQQ